jgi:anti-sigma factor RsiW
MSCDRYREALADAAAGGGPAPELEAHLEECEACREERDARRRALTVADAELERLLASTPSPDLSARIQRAVAADEGTRSGLSRGRPALAAAAALVMALGAITAWRAASRPSVSETVQQDRLEPTPLRPADREDGPGGGGGRRANAVRAGSGPW